MILNLSPAAIATILDVLAEGKQGAEKTLMIHEEQFKNTKERDTLITLEKQWIDRLDGALREITEQARLTDET